MKFNILVYSALLIVAYSLVAAPIPTRHSPPAMPIVKPLSKQVKARLLKLQAEALEQEVAEDLSIAISNKIHSIDFSTTNQQVTINNISYMKLETNFIIQVTFSYADK